jgi:queuine/archaeosine tRNA-ribosyltransferase
MADICVIFAKEDKAVVSKLVMLLRNYWDVWWAEDIAQGDWEQEVRLQIRMSKAVIPVISGSTENKNIFKDELKYAEKQGRLMFPFCIEQAEPPFGFGNLNRTDAISWKGAVNDPGYQQLLKKITAELKKCGCEEPKLKRVPEIEIHGKTLQLPCFVFSLSSHETQVSPKDGVSLFQFLSPAAGLISAYDTSKYYKGDRNLKKMLENLISSNSVIFLDSGNYEASRKNDHYSEKNSDGWHRDSFRQVASKIPADIVFAYDDTNPTGGLEEVADAIVDNFRSDEIAISRKEVILCPIIHLPKKFKISIAECASKIIAKVVKSLDPVIVAIPERELGDGLLERAKTVRQIRKTLDGLGKYYPLHLLGTGNPISMLTLAAAGADSFDGLEWCRTVADYDNGNLFHFQHFDCFSDRYIMRLQPGVRKIIEDPQAAYGARVASYNLDFFNEWTRTIQNMIHSGQMESPLKLFVPNIGATLYKELSK